MSLSADEPRAHAAPGDVPPRVWTLGPAGGLQIQVMDLGATWLSCRVPLPGGELRETLLGHPSPAAHLAEPGYLGATIGRYANRIAGARYSHGGTVYTLLANEGANQLHGGPEGFHRRRWQLLEAASLRLRLGLHSPAGDQGYPGALDAQVCYELDAAALSVTVRFTATVDAPCPVVLTQHAYHNLDGQPAGRASSALTHALQVAADTVLPVRPDMIPTGAIAAVDGTAFDLRQPRPVGARLGEGEQQALAGGYDHCYVLQDAAARGAAPAARLTSADGRLGLDLHTNYPALQVYSGNHLAQARDRDGQPLVPHAGIALEPQFFPDAPNQWPDMGCMLLPGQTLARWMRITYRTP